MAKPEEKPESESAPPEAATGISKKTKLLVLLLVGLLLLALLALGALTLLLIKQRSTQSGEGADPTSITRPTTPPPITVNPSSPPVFVALDPFVVNLAPGEGERYLQTIIVLRLADSKFDATLKQYLPEVQHRINLLLSSKLPSELVTPQGREQLARELTDEINRVLGYPPPPAGQQPLGPTGPVQAVLFRSFIIQ
ncbi:flagellar basal body-associated FliL family protein [Tepidiphilus olei]|uniref:flagellar basal body-associated FliL family protein n=1 Tax=Tepidiphilus olei TaxID=2502184 RepID=UPI00115C8C5E|nr:flagellar basal body-associated FliL family protein [Tepidiphilus olei]